jgi:hypothetical protein
MNWIDGSCEFVDGLGGGGGGGGAGGCGGAGGAAGIAGGPSIGVMVRVRSATQVPVMQNLRIEGSDGAPGGDGGAGGDGAPGSNGASGGNLPLGMLSTPTLAGAAPGARGGHGAQGGGGGGGGGGCGGASIGLWLNGYGADPDTAAALRRDNTISVARGGSPGSGGSGPVPASSGQPGAALDVLVN